MPEVTNAGDKSVRLTVELTVATDIEVWLHDADVSDKTIDEAIRIAKERFVAEHGRYFDHLKSEVVEIIEAGTEEQT